MRRSVVAAILFVLIVIVVHGQTADQQPFVVQYIDGSVQVQLKGQTAWKTLKVKHEVPADATVKLAKGAMIELKRDSDKMVLSLIKDGIYPMASLLAKVQSTGSGLGSTVAQKIRAVSGGQLIIPPGTSAGVNALPGDYWSKGWYTALQKQKDEKDKAYDLVNKIIPAEGFVIDNLQFFYWGIRGGYAELENPRMYEEYKDAIDKGIRALLDAQYDTAIGHLRNAVTYAIFPEEKRRSSYLLAVAYVEAGSPVRAWQILSTMNVTKDDFEYNDFLIRKAQLQVDALLYDDALATLKPLIDPLVKNEFGQAACLVAYYAYKGLNRHREASDIKDKGLKIPVFFDDSKGNMIPVETEAARLLTSLE